jgi:hypothetical protein
MIHQSRIPIHNCVNSLPGRLKLASLTLALISAFSLQPSALFGQGSLTPPGAPAPTMKSLDQIDSHVSLAGEKRIDVLSLAGDGGNLHVISNSGSYYLSGNLTASGAKNGIKIAANDVTLDLNGFTVDGTGCSGTVDGISASGTNATICSGTVQKWTGNGINCLGSTYVLRRLNCQNNGQYGVLGNLDTPVNNGYLVSDCHFFKNGYWGILIYFGSARIEGCVAEQNGSAGGAGGIYYSGLGGSVINCVATSNFNTNNAGAAISASVVTGCDAEANQGDGISGGTVTSCTAISNGGKGISGGNATVVNCNASGNGGGGIVVGTSLSDQSGGAVLNCCASVNSVAGIIAGTNCVVANCTAFKNSGDGIRFGGKCLIKDNNASSNSGNGFRVTGSGAGALNRIDGNTAVSNGANGILWANDLVVRNSCFLNGVNYNPAVGGGNTAPVQAASSATNPWANF